MTYQRSTWISLDPDGGAILAKSVQTVSGDSGWIYVGNVGSIVLVLDSDAGAGTTPALAVNVTTSYSSTDVHEVAVPGGTFTSVATTASKQLIKITDFQGYIKVTWTITGTTPSFNFGVFASARRSV